MHLIKELRWRGLVHDIMPGTEEQLEREMTTGYIGFDPTSDSLHIGSLVPILLLVHLQRAGHKPIALVGGATGMVGDPSGKSEERNLLSTEVLQHNIAGIRSQLARYLDFDSSHPNAAELVNNFDWFSNMNFLDFIRDVGKHISINYMMAKDSVKKRLEGDSGMSFTEFTYQLVQGYDFYWLYTHHNCKLQMGGSDQWGNITTGTELVRRKAGGEAFAFTCPLLTKSDGGKFGKTEKGNIWLDKEKTSPYHFYQFWLNASDDDAVRWIRIFTFLAENDIMLLEQSHAADPGQRLLQKALAKALTEFVHGEAEYENALQTTSRLFASQQGSITELSEADLQLLDGLVQSDYPLDKLSQGVDVISFLTETNIFSSKGEARKMLLNGGVSINREKISDPQMIVGQSNLLYNKYVLVQKGKKNFYLVSAK